MDMRGVDGVQIASLAFIFVQAVASELDAVCFVNDSTDNGVRIADAALSAGTDYVFYGKGCRTKDRSVIKGMIARSTDSG